MKKSRTLHILRRLTQTGFFLFILVMPIFNILRYNPTTKELFIFGSVWSLGLEPEFYSDTSIYGISHVTTQILLKAILPWISLLMIFPLMGFFFGRTFCGWLCPEGALFELADFLTIKIFSRRSLYKNSSNVNHKIKQVNKFFYIPLTVFLSLTLPPIVGIALSGYFISPMRIWHEIKNLDISEGLQAGIIGVSIYILITSVFVRHTLCKYVCAPGLMQTLFGWISPISLRIKFDTRNSSLCTDCKRCEDVCFMDVKPRKQKKDINCVNCAECLNACRGELGKNCLFSYTFNDAKKKQSISKVIDLT